MSVEGIIDLLREEACKKINKKVTPWALSGLGSFDDVAAEIAKFGLEKVKLIKKWAEAAGFTGLPLPDKLKLC